MPSSNRPARLKSSRGTDRNARCGKLQGAAGRRSVEVKAVGLGGVKVIPEGDGDRLFVFDKREMRDPACRQKLGGAIRHGALGVPSDLGLSSHHT